MRNKPQVIILFLVLILVLCHTGCMTTTQQGTAIGAGTGAGIGALVGSISGNAGMGAAIGAGVGAVGGALVADSIDQKREEREKAELQRQLEHEGTVSKKSTYYQGRSNSRSQKPIYTDVVKSKAEDHLFERYWVDDHWAYTPTNNSDEANLFRRVSGKDGRWEYISVINKKVIEKQQNQEKHSSSEDKMIKEVEETFDKEFNAMRSEQQNKQ